MFADCSGETMNKSSRSNSVYLNDCDERPTHAYIDDYFLLISCAREGLVEILTGDAAVFDGLFFFFWLFVED